VRVSVVVDQNAIKNMELLILIKLRKLFSKEISRKIFILTLEQNYFHLTVISEIHSVISISVLPRHMFVLCVTGFIIF
jgi:hypothetical protein